MKKKKSTLRQLYADILILKIQIEALLEMEKNKKK
jgi:hypothetical protein